MLMNTTVSRCLVGFYELEPLLLSKRLKLTFHKKKKGRLYNNFITVQMHWKAHLLRLFQTFSHRCSHTPVLRKWKLAQTHMHKHTNTYKKMFIWKFAVCVCVCVYVCVFVSTANRGHTPTLHIQTEDIANEDSPRFVDTCKRLQIAYSCIYGYVEKKRENNILLGTQGLVLGSALKSHTQVVCPHSPWFTSTCVCVCEFWFVLASI